jgi:hypothetical protein
VVHVVDVLYAMNVIENKAVGDDGISIEFLKIFFEFIARTYRLDNANLQTVGSQVS